MATPPGRLAPGDTWGPAAAWVGHRLPVVRASGGRQNAFFSGVASTHTKLHVKSEGGMGWTKLRMQNLGRLGRLIWVSKP